MQQAKIRVIMGLVIFVALLGLPMMASAHGGDPTKIHSCVNNNSGEVKIVAPNATCNNNWTPVDWDKASRTVAATFTVHCNAGETIQGALKDLIPGDVLKVSGTCNENVVISGTVVGYSIGGITLDGQGSATIHGPDMTKPTVDILAHGITIKGFTITGGRDGIVVERARTATISGNTITGTAAQRDGIIVTTGGVATIGGNTVQNWGRFGISLAQNGTARITNNTVQNNSSDGILVEESSSARIGFQTFSDTSPGPNTIQNNGRHGVNVNRSSSAVILSNTITGNLHHGVGVFRASHADVGGNTIESNGFPGPVSPATNDGIRVEENSGVNLGQPGVSFSVGANSTTANNQGFGVKCRFGGYVRGDLGTLNGASGPPATNLDGTCINALGL